MSRSDRLPLLAAIRLSIQIAAVSVWICAVLPFRKLPWILTRIEAGRSASGVKLTDKELAARIRLIDRFARSKLFLIRNNCLRKNLLFYYFLIRAGVTDLRIHIGVSKDRRDLKGHCWLTLRGRVFLDTDEAVSPYTIMYSSGV